MRKPRRDGDRYEKHLEGPMFTPPVPATHIIVWDDESSTYVTKPLAVSEGEAFRDLLMTGESFQRVKGSGSSAEKKGDLKSESFLLQAKSTVKKSFTVKLDDLRKAEREAMNLGKKPLFVVGFYENDRVTDEWVLIPKWALNE